MQGIRKLKILNEIIHTTYCTSRYVFENHDKVTIETEYGDKLAYYFENQLVGYINDRITQMPDDMGKLKQILDDYMEFDSDELFLCGDLIHIFGGAIRDAIGGNKINDIDVLGTSLSREKLCDLMMKKGYTQLEEMNKNSLNQMYKDIKIISMPITFINSNKKMIQLIFPVTNEGYEKSFHHLVSNVDLSCCGLSYNGLNVYEYVDDAYTNAMEKTFRVCADNKMYNKKRCEDRMDKLLLRGFIDITSLDDARINRIDNIISDETVRNVLTVKPIRRWNSPHIPIW